MNLSVFVLLGVLALIAARKVGRIRVSIWQAMVAGALAVLACDEIPPAAALAAIDMEVMLFLFGMFVLGEALVESGYLYAVAYRWLSRVRTTDTLVLAVVVASGLASALLMNDTLAIIATPLVLRLGAPVVAGPGLRHHHRQCHEPDWQSTEPFDRGARPDRGAIRRIPAAAGTAHAHQPAALLPGAAHPVP